MNKNRRIIIIILLLVLIIIVVSVWLFVLPKSVQVALTKEQAIEFIQQKYPELQDYPSDKLAPRSIVAEKSSEGWYVAFIQNGSGRPIISAKCFLLKSDNSLTKKDYTVPLGDMGMEFSAKNCATMPNDNNGNNQETKCGIQNCHGLDIKCGPNVPEVCTAIYQLGDKCRQYAACEVVNGNCQLTANPKFNTCKACVDACAANAKNDSMKIFDCEAKCK